MVKYRVRKDRTRVPQGETPADKFLRLAERRINRALTSIRLLGNLASANYTYKQEDVRMLRQELNQAVEATFSKFDVVKQKPTTTEFHFPRAASARPRTRKANSPAAPLVVA